MTTILNAPSEMFPENVLVRHAVLRSANALRDRMELMSSDARDALIRDLIETFDLVVGVIELAPDIHQFHTIKRSHGATVTGIPFVSPDVAQAIGEQYASEVIQNPEGA